MALGAALLLGYSACAFPEFEFEDEDGSNGAGGSNAASSGGAPSTGGAAPCVPGQQGVCGPDMKCTVVDLDTGAVGCAMAGSKPKWARCNGDADCVDGTWCDPPMGVCKPFCGGQSECVDGNFSGECVPLRKDATNTVPGTTKHCTADCNPKSATPCATGDNVTCVYTGPNGFDCAVTENHTSGAPCVDSPDCGPGLLCVNVGTRRAPDFRCKYWCTPAGGISDDCPPIGDVCYPLDPMVSYHGQEHGTCP